MQRDNIHYGGWEHRDVHNINGMLFVSRHIVVVIIALRYNIVESNITSRNVPHRPTSSAVCVDSLILRWLTTIRSNVDWR